MTTPLSASAADSREHARKDTGRFGNQPHDDSGVVDPQTCRHGRVGFCYDELSPVQQEAFERLYQHAYDWATTAYHNADDSERYASTPRGTTRPRSATTVS